MLQAARELWLTRLWDIQRMDGREERGWVAKEDSNTAETALKAKFEVHHHSDDHQYSQNDGLIDHGVEIQHFEWTE
jgi:hypothetical protein